MEDQPPSYNSMFGQLRQMKDESSNPIDFSKKICTIVTGSGNYLFVTIQYSFYSFYLIYLF